MPNYIQPYRAGALIQGAAPGAGSQSFAPQQLMGACSPQGTPNPCGDGVRAQCWTPFRISQEIAAGATVDIVTTVGNVLTAFTAGWAQYMGDPALFLINQISVSGYQYLPTPVEAEFYTAAAKDDPPIFTFTFDRITPVVINVTNLDAGDQVFSLVLLGLAQRGGSIPQY